MERVNQPIDGECRVLFGDLAEVGITRGCGGTGMTEQRLDVAQAQALFKQVRGEGMPE